MSTYNLTINAAALNLGATSFAELVFRRATVTDTYTIVPEFKSRVVMVGGMASIRLPATTPGSVYECLIYGELRQKLRVFFVMPEADSLLHELALWTAWPNADSQGGGRAKWGLITGTLADQTDLQTALNGKANTAHTHTIGQVDGLQTALDGKSNVGHGHSMSDVAGLNSTVSDLQAADAALANDLLGRIANTEKGAANGVAPLDAGSKVPAAYLPSFVDDVLEYANQAAFPVSGETGKIYTALDTNKVYRWSGTVYVEISASPGSTDAVPEGVTNKYFTESRVLNTVLTGISFASTMAVLATDGVLTAFGKVQAQINDRLSNLSTPSATGIALNMAKSGTLGQIRALIAGQDIDVSATGTDGVTISTVGRTLRYWTESLGIYGTNAYRLFKPVRQVADGDLRVSPMLGGLRSTNVYTATDYGISFGNPDYADHTGTLGPGSLDLQVRKSVADNLPSGTACVAIGQDNKVTGSRNVAISAINGATTVSGNDNYYIGPIIGNAVTGGDMNYSYGGTRVVGGFNKVFGGHGLGGGFYGAVTGNHNIAMTGYSTVTGDGNTILAPTAEHTASHGLILASCPIVYGQSLRPRNMVAVSVRSSDLRINTSPGAQVVELYLGGMSGFDYDGSWNTLTSNGLAAGSTNVYVAGGDFFFAAYVTVFAPAGDRAGVFKFDGYVRNVGYSPELIVNKTTLYNPDATKGDAQIVWSSGKLLVQVSATSGTGAQKVNGSAFLQCIEPGPSGGY